MESLEQQTREELKMEQGAEHQSPTPAIQEEEDLPPPAKKKRGRKKGQKSKPKNITSVKVEVEMNPHCCSSGGGGSSSRRCTRSQVAPDWSVEETRVLVSEISTLDEDWLKAFSSYQKWKMISDNCMVMKVARSSNQCKRRWESVLSDYYKIKQWEATSSYWCLGALERQHHHLPASFDHEVFASIDALFNAQDAPSTDSEDIISIHEEQEEMGNTDLEMEKMKQIMPNPSPKDSTDMRIALHNKNRNNDDDNPIYINMPEDEMFDADADFNADLGSAETGSKNIVSMGLEMAKPKENTEQVHPIESIDNVKRLHATESKENTTNMQNKLQENVEQILAINSMDNSSRMANNLQENTEEICVIESVDNAQGVVNYLAENAEQMHAIVGLDSAVNMTNKLLENGRQIHETHRGMDSALEIANNLRENAEEIHAIKGTKAIVSKLQENAELIHAILRGDLRDHSSQGRALVDNTMETRRQADELIKAFSTLVGTLDQFTNLIKDGKCEGIRGMDPLVLFKQSRHSANK